MESRVRYSFDKMYMQDCCTSPFEATQARCQCCSMTSPAPCAVMCPHQVVKRTQHRCGPSMMTSSHRARQQALNAGPDEPWNVPRSSTLNPPTLATSSVPDTIPSQHNIAGGLRMSSTIVHSVATRDPQIFPNGPQSLHMLWRRRFFLPDSLHPRLISSMS